MWELGMSARVLLALKEARVKVREYVARTTSLEYYFKIWFSQNFFKRK